jgi:hypothetical protein
MMISLLRSEDPEVEHLTRGSLQPKYGTCSDNNKGFGTTTGVDDLGGLWVDLSPFDS